MNFKNFVVHHWENRLSLAIFLRINDFFSPSETIAPAWKKMVIKCSSCSTYAFGIEKKKEKKCWQID